MVPPRARERAKLVNICPRRRRPHCPGKLNVGRRHRGVRHSEGFSSLPCWLRPRQRSFEARGWTELGRLTLPSPRRPSGHWRRWSALPCCLVGCAQGSGACATGPGGARARLGSLRPARLSPRGIVPRLMHGAVFRAEGAARLLATWPQRPRVRCVRQPGRLADTIIPW
jgi:hypothetical protein